MKKTKVKIIKSNNKIEFEQLIETFINNTSYNIHDIQFSTSTEGATITVYCAMILWNTKEI